MRSTHIFKGGFEVGEKDNFFAYQLTVVSEKVDVQQAYRLSQVVDAEYKKILTEQCDIKKGGGVEQWLGRISE